MTPNDSRSGPIGESRSLDIWDDRWMAYISAHPQAVIFHHPAWMEIIADCYGYEPFILCLLDEQNQISAGMPLMKISNPWAGRRWVSLPFSDYCQPLANDGASRMRLLENCASFLEDGRLSKILIRWPVQTQHDCYPGETFYLHTVPLNPQSSVVLSQVHRTQKQNIHTAEKSGIVIEWPDPASGMAIFYDLFVRTHRRLGVPAQPVKFFHQIRKKLLERGLGYILLASRAGQYLSGGLFLHWQKTLTYKYSASQDFGQEFRPNHAVTWNAMQWGCANGDIAFDFGRADCEDSGLRTFKTRWGAEERLISYTILSKNEVRPMKNVQNNLTRKVIQKAPLWFCRMTGELLYRYFG